MSNQITMQARLGKDPEIKAVGETQVCNLWVAESEKFKNRDGETVENTCWWSCEIWGKRAEVVAQYFSKGDGILIRGSLRQRKHEERTYYTVRVSDFEFPMGKRGDSDSPSSTAQAGPANASPPEDDIPF